MRMPSAKEAILLRLLLEGGDTYGLDLVKQSRGAVTRGSVYVLLMRLEEKKMVRSRPGEQVAGTGGATRRVYAITGEGRRALAGIEAAEAAWAKGAI